MIEDPLKGKFERSPVMNAEETLAYVEELGLKKIRIEETPNQSVVYVFPQYVVNEAFKLFPLEKRATMVTIDTVEDFRVDEHSHPDEIYYWLKNDNNMVRYYVINKVTKKPQEVRASANRREYLVAPARLFRADKKIFT